MKLLVIGDSHDNIVNLRHVIGFAKTIGVKAIVHTGDWNNLKSVDIVLKSKTPLYACLGNADIDPKFEFKELTKFKIDGIKIGVVHRLINYQWLTAKDFDVIFTGHYHSQKEWEVNGVKIIRPGALENNINFAVFDTNTKIVEFINE